MLCQVQIRYRNGVVLWLGLYSFVSFCAHARKFSTICACYVLDYEWQRQKYYSGLIKKNVSLFLYGNFVFVLVQLHNVDQMSTNVFITESLVFVVLTMLKVQEVMWIVIADYYLILPASSDHLTLRASIILWLKCPLLAAVVFHFCITQHLIAL